MINGGKFFRMTGNAQWISHPWFS